MIKKFHWKTDIHEGPALFAAVLNSLFVFSLGLFMALPFDSFTGHVAFAVMAQTMPELAWGILFMICGAFRLTGIIVDKFRVVKYSTFLTFLLWIVVEISFLSSDWTVPIVVIGFFLAAQGGHHYIMIKDPENLPNKKNRAII